MPCLGLAHLHPRSSICNRQPSWRCSRPRVDLHHPNPDAYHGVTFAPSAALFSTAANDFYRDEIAGIGPTRKKALLQAFGSAKAVSRASANDLAAVEGVSTALAQTIYEHFHDGAE